MLVAHEKNLGGASKALVTLAEELQEKGHKVVAIVPFKSGQVKNKLVEKCIITYTVFFGWWMMPSYWNMFLKASFCFLYALEEIAVLRISKIAKAENIDVIHSNSSVIDVGARTAVRIGLPHVWHFREFGDADYRLEFIKGRKKSCEFVERTGSRVVFISHNLREYYFDISDENCELVYDGISDAFLSVKDKEREISKPIFLISGNLQRNKGQITALKAAKILLDNKVENFELWVAGKEAAVKDSKNYAQELYEFSTLNLNGHCRFLGYVEDMKNLRKKADVELVCSDREAFGLVTIEAMMASNPVIGADTGATTELVEDKITGRLFKCGDAKDLSNKMLWFINETKNISKCGDTAYNFAKNVFLSGNNTDRIEMIYKNMLNMQ